jgi:hypothetical protein
LEELTYLKLDQLGFTDDSTLFADSTCPDEINHADPSEDVTALYQKRWGELFPLGGLAGFPFTGKTGWSAFSSHCPKDGNIVILFAPHVGVDLNGKIGSFFRDGQDCSSRACGAAIGAYFAAKEDSNVGDFKNGYLDHQMDCIQHLLVPKVPMISKAKNEMADLAYHMYTIQLEFIEQILNSNWMDSGSKLALIGGLQINCDGERNDMFLPLIFEVRDKAGNKSDVYEEVFGKVSPIHKFKENISGAYA